MGGPYGTSDVDEAEHIARSERGLERQSGGAKSWLSELSGDDELTPEASPARFAMIGIFCSASFGSALGWLSYAPIADVAEEHFDVGAGWINLIANLFLILYIPGSALSLWLTEAHGLAANVQVGIWLSFFMCLIKWVGAIIPDPHAGFAVTVLGQVVGAAGQPLLLNVAARLSMDWFPEHERDYATTAATMSNVIGQMVASFGAPIIAGAYGIARVQLVQVYFFVVVLVAAMFLLPEKPMHAPSPAAAIQWAKRSQNPHHGARDALQNAWREVSELLRNNNFLLLMSGFAVATGSVWALLMLEQQVVTPCGYSDEFAGVLGAALLGTGVVCAFGLSSVMERTKEYVILQKGNLVLYAFAVAAVYGDNRPNNRAGLLTSWCFLGAVLQPLMPLTLEHAAEISFPCSADSSTALLLVGANTIGMVLMFLLTPLLELPVSVGCTSVVTPAAAVVFSLVLVGMVLTLFVRRDYRRQAAEHARNLQDLPPELREGLIVAHQQHHAHGNGGSAGAGGSGARAPQGSGSGGGTKGGKGGGRSADDADDPTKPLLRPGAASASSSAESALGAAAPVSPTWGAAGGGVWDGRVGR